MPKHHTHLCTINAALMNEHWILISPKLGPPSRWTPKTVSSSDTVKEKATLQRKHTAACWTLACWIDVNLTSSDRHHLRQHLSAVSGQTTCIADRHRMNMSTPSERFKTFAWRLFGSTETYFPAVVEECETTSLFIVCSMVSPWTTVHGTV